MIVSRPRISRREGKEWLQKSEQALCSEGAVRCGFAASAVPADPIFCSLQASIVISTTTIEFFGMAVVEAVRAGFLPLLPDRLAYPELLRLRISCACTLAGRFGEMIDTYRRPMQWISEVVDRTVCLA